MSRVELQSEIQQLLETVPENVLAEVLKYLQGIKDVAPEDLKQAHNLNRILQEDRELLEKLAS
jgi:hypothetical protein